MPEAITIVGPGVVGTALGVALRAAGHRVVAVTGPDLDAAWRSAERIGEGKATTDIPVAARLATLVLVTVPDRAIVSVAWTIAAGGPLPPGALALHTSGYFSSNELAPIREAGGAVGSLHPLQSFATVDDAIRLLPGTRCFVEGDETERVRALVTGIGGVPVSIATDAKPLYHAAAATASNLLVTVIDLALAIAESAGLERGEMLEALLPLIEGSVENVRAVGIPQALTGPVSRGDLGTLDGHLDALGRVAPELLPDYAALALRTVEVAVRKGTIGAESAQSMRDRLKNVGPPGGAE